ncbi:MAG: IS3 family transposase [Verrucomicrobiales bacterium]|nr:IS3 family transposase [Verrucomicrobiales bacterium]
MPPPPARHPKKSHEPTGRGTAGQYALIDQLRSHFPSPRLCDALAVSRSGYHASRRRQPGPRARQQVVLLQAIEKVRAHRHARCYGSPRMTHQLRRQGHQVSENRVARLMRANHLRARPRRPYRPKTTQPDHAACPSPNLLASAPAPIAPGQQLVSDITYIPTAEGWLYLALVVDRFSRSVFGWHLADSFTRTGLPRPGPRPPHRPDRPQAIFHSDRGCQYTAALLRGQLARLGLRQSMSARGHCYDNAMAESVFAALKAEALPPEQPFASRALARSALFDYLETFYNRQRLHSSLGYRPPREFLDLYFQTHPLALH